MTETPAPVEIVAGDGPVILGMPHTGTFVPPDVWAALNETGRQLGSTDWHVERLYAGLLPGATTVRATFSRYVIDPNRDPSTGLPDPGESTTSLVPMTDLDGQPIWTVPPTAAQIAARRAAFHEPYHKALAAQIARVKARHGVAILYDCHAIRSLLPFLFEGRLPDFNIADHQGETCAPAVTRAVREAVSHAKGYTRAVNGRFRGGWSIRHWGRPKQGVHAIQMELAKITYLAAEGPPFTYDEAKAAQVRPVLADILARLAALAPELAAG